MIFIGLDLPGPGTYDPYKPKPKGPIDLVIILLFFKQIKLIKPCIIYYVPIMLLHYLIIKSASGLLINYHNYDLFKCLEFYYYIDYWGTAEKDFFSTGTILFLKYAIIGLF